MTKMKTQMQVRNELPSLVSRKGGIEAGLESRDVAVDLEDWKRRKKFSEAGSEVQLRPWLPACVDEKLHNVEKRAAETGSGVGAAAANQREREGFSKGFRKPS